MTADRPPSLRDQIAQAMRDANGTPEALAAWQRHPQLVPVDVYADAVLPVIEAETAALREQAQAVVDEVLSICDSFETAPDGSPEYIYSLGRKDGLDWVRAAVERAMGKGERNSIPYVPKERAEEAERERDTAREALDAAAIVIASLRDQRNEQRQRADKAERRVEHFEEHAAQVDADLGIETHRAETAERKLQQALDQIATERRGRLAAEAAARRGREIHRPHDCARHVSARTPVPCANHGLCEGCGAPHPCKTATALTIKQPKETR